MAAAPYRLTFRRGDSYARTFNVTLKATGAPKDLTGYTARLQVRRHADSPTPFLTLTTDPGGGITLGSSSITVTQDTAATAAMKWAVGVWSLELVAPGGTVTPLLAGDAEVLPEITNP